MLELWEAPPLHWDAAEVRPMKLVHGSLVGVLCFAALFACKDKGIDRDGNESPGDRSGAAGDRSGTTTVTGANVGGGLSNALAVERVVAARCARETACNNIGSDKHFTDYDVCSRQLRMQIGKDLDPGACPSGIDAKELDECLESIRTESCNNPIDTISRLAACRTSDMCLKTGAPNR